MGRLGPSNQPQFHLALYTCRFSALESKYWLLHYMNLISPIIFAGFFQFCRTLLWSKKFDPRNIEKGLNHIYTPKASDRKNFKIAKLWFSCVKYLAIHYLYEEVMAKVFSIWYLKLHINKFSNFDSWISENKHMMWKYPHLQYFNLITMGIFMVRYIESSESLQFNVNNLQKLMYIKCSCVKLW